MLKGGALFRIATFNIWDHESLWFERLEVIYEEILKIADIILYTEFTF